MFRVTRAFTAKAVTATRRAMSGGSHEENLKEISNWKKYSVVMFALTAVCAAYNLAVHEHDHQNKTDLSYMKIRNKPFPWKCQNCDFFDVECWAACKEEAK